MYDFYIFFILYFTALFFFLYTKDIWQYIRNIDIMAIFSTALAYSCGRKNI